MRIVCTALAVLLGLGASGCGLADPYVQQPTPAQRRATPAVASPEPPRPRRPAPVRTPDLRAVLQRFAEAVTNWSWRSQRAGAQDQRALSTGSLRAQLAGDARRAGEDAELRRERITNRGRVLAIDVTRPADAYVVVRETQRSDGIVAIGDTTLRVYRARLLATAAGWRVAGWAVAG